MARQFAPFAWLDDASRHYSILCTLHEDVGIVHTETPDFTFLYFYVTNKHTAHLLVSAADVSVCIEP